MRGVENRTLARQVRFPDDDLVYPTFPEEVDDIDSAPSDGGNYIVYENFEQFVRETIKWRTEWYLQHGDEIPTRAELWVAWKKWVAR